MVRTLSSSSYSREVHPESGAVQSDGEQEEEGEPPTAPTAFGLGVGQRLQKLTRIYGKAFVVSAIVTPFVVFFGGIKWTRWKDGEVPMVDLDLFTFGFLGLLIAAFALRCVFAVGAHDPFPKVEAPHYRWRYTVGTFPGVILGGLLVCVPSYVIPYLLGLNPHFLLLDVPFLCIGAVGGLFLGNLFMYYLYTNDSAALTPTDEEGGIEEKERGEVSLATNMWRLLHVCLIGTVMVLYPAVVGFAKRQHQP